MITDEINEKPCLVETKQGFSICYKERFLYSKYNPSKLIIDKINSLNILPGTLILCNSPVLDYGINELISKVPESCQLVICEFDDTLRAYIQKNLKLKIAVPTKQELYDLPVILNKKQYIFQDNTELLPSGSFKRILRIDFSAGIQFNSELYSQLEEACINSIKTFWANRVTLVKFGRKYTQNLFSNLQNIDKTIPISNFFTSVSKPVIVFGAAESLEQDIQYIRKNRKNFYILCVDTALLPLIGHSIIPDGVFIEEAQNVITKAFIGTQQYNFHVFAALSSISSLSQIFSLNQISYFTTVYTEDSFLQRMISAEVLPPANRPFGSVGITSVYYALRFRKNTSVPVYYYGLDFSYSAGFTHTRGALAHTLRLINNNRITPVHNYAASFGATSIRLSNNNSCFTTPTLMNYKTLFTILFENQINLFSGNVKNCQITESIEDFYYNKPSAKTAFSETKQYLETEKAALLRIRSLLTGETKLSSEEELKNELYKLCANREYLYLHFPDGWKFTYSQSFLNRIRTEIDFFLKWL